MSVGSRGLGRAVLGLVLAGACTPTGRDDTSIEQELEDVPSARAHARAVAAWDEEGEWDHHRCAHMVCVAGRFEVLEALDDGHYRVRFDSRIPSSASHPNATISVADDLWSQTSRLDVGEAYAMVAAVGKHHLLSALAVRPDDTRGRRFVHDVITSRDVYLNDGASRLRWRAWEGLRRSYGEAQVDFVAWESSPDARFLAVTELSGRTFVYDQLADARYDVGLADDDAAVTNITFTRGQFWLWSRLRFVGTVRPPGHATDGLMRGVLPLARHTVLPFELQALLDELEVAAANQDQPPALPRIWATDAEYSTLHTEDYAFTVDDDGPRFGWIRLALAGLPTVNNITVDKHRRERWHDEKPLVPLW